VKLRVIEAEGVCRRGRVGARAGKGEKNETIMNQKNIYSEVTSDKKPRSNTSLKRQRRREGHQK